MGRPWCDLCKNTGWRRVVLCLSSVTGHKRDIGAPFYFRQTCECPAGDTYAARRRQLWEQKQLNHGASDGKEEEPPTVR